MKIMCACVLWPYKNSKFVLINVFVNNITLLGVLQIVFTVSQDTSCATSGHKCHRLAIPA